MLAALKVLLLRTLAPKRIAGLGGLIDARHGRIAMTASIQLRDIQFPISHTKLTA